MTIQVACFCGKERRSAKCHVGLTALSCTQPCRKRLGCGNSEHLCAEPCHEGPCPPCLRREDIRCWCGQQTKSVACGEIKANDGTKCVLVKDDGSEQVWTGTYGCGHPCERYDFCSNEIIADHTHALLPVHSLVCTIAVPRYAIRLLQRRHRVPSIPSASFRARAVVVVWPAHLTNLQRTERQVRLHSSRHVHHVPPLSQPARPLAQIPSHADTYVKRNATGTPAHHVPNKSNAPVAVALQNIRHPAAMPSSHCNRPTTL